MAINVDNLVHAARPGNDEIDLEFSRIDHDRILGQALSTGGPAASPGRRLPKRWMGMAAGLTALVVAGGALATQSHRAPLPVTVRPSVPVTSTASAAPARGAAVLALYTVARSASHQRPLVIGAHQFLHVTFIETQTGDSAGQVVHDTYIASDGWTWRHDTGSHALWMLYNAAGEGPTSLASLPTDPVKLDAELRSGTGNNSDDERVWKGVDEILVSNAASPALRAAAIRVLQNLAQHPHSPQMGKEGRATPKVTVRWVPLTGGRQGLQATFTDAATRPGQTMTITLDEQGDMVSTSQNSPDSTFVSSYPVRQLVEALPADFVSQLGTTRKHIER